MSYQKILEIVSLLQQKATFSFQQDSGQSTQAEQHRKRFTFYLCDVFVTFWFNK